MKTINQLCRICLFSIAFTGVATILTAQKKTSDKAVQIKNMLDSQRYVFHAKSVVPSSGRQRYLTSEYIVSISKDTVISDLPYFGRAYSASIGNTDGGIRFTSVKFTYSKVAGKKGSWKITIKPTDNRDVQQLLFTVYDNGTAYLTVNSNNRQSISFNGDINPSTTKY